MREVFPAGQLGGDSREAAGEVNELEVRAVILAALRAPGPCDECEGCTFGDVGLNPWTERLARAIEDGDVVIKVAAEAWL